MAEANKQTDPLQEAINLLRAEAARLLRIYGDHHWFGFYDEKAAYQKHLAAAEALESFGSMTAPADPLDWPIPCDLTAGSVTLCKGVPLRTVQMRLQVQSDANLLLIKARAAPAAATGPTSWRELAARVMDALAEAQERTNEKYPEHVKCYPNWVSGARWLRWHAEMFRTGKPIGNGAGQPSVIAALNTTAAQGDALDGGKLHFWVADDPDTAHENLYEAVMEAFETNGVEPGGFVEIQREISLPNILVRITSTNPFAFEEVPDAAIAAQAAGKGEE